MNYICDSSTNLWVGIQHLLSDQGLPHQLHQRDCPQHPRPGQKWNYIQI